MASEAAERIAVLLRRFQRCGAAGAANHRIAVSSNGRLCKNLDFWYF
jgi:hypothetical protein